MIQSRTNDNNLIKMNVNEDVTAAQKLSTPLSVSDIKINNSSSQLPSLQHNNHKSEPNNEGSFISFPKENKKEEDRQCHDHDMSDFPFFAPSIAIDQRGKKDYHLSTTNTNTNNTRSSSGITTSNNINKGDDNDDYHSILDSLGPYDVICGRKPYAFNNCGNRRFRMTIANNVDAYNSINGRHQKGQFIGRLVDSILKESGAKFYKLKRQQIVSKVGDNAGNYNGSKQMLVELTVKQVRAKVGHALRDSSAFKASQQIRTKQPKKVRKHHDNDKVNKVKTSEESESQIKSVSSSSCRKLQPESHFSRSAGSFLPSLATNGSSSLTDHLRGYKFYSSNHHSNRNQYAPVEISDNKCIDQKNDMEETINNPCLLFHPRMFDSLSSLDDPHKPLQELKSNGYHHQHHRQQQQHQERINTMHTKIQTENKYKRDCEDNRQTTTTAARSATFSNSNSSNSDPLMIPGKFFPISTTVFSNSNSIKSIGTPVVPTSTTKSWNAFHFSAPDNVCDGPCQRYVQKEQQHQLQHRSDFANSDHKRSSSTTSSSSTRSSGGSSTVARVINQHLSTLDQELFGRSSGNINKDSNKNDDIDMKDPFDNAELTINYGSNSKGDSNHPRL